MENVHEAQDAANGRAWWVGGVLGLLGGVGGSGWGCRGVGGGVGWRWGCWVVVVGGSFYVFVTNGVEIRDGELSSTSNEVEFEYASIRC